MKGKRKLTQEQRIANLEKQVKWLSETAFQTVADSVAEQASACQAMLKVLADLHPDRRMVAMVTEDGRKFYEFRLISEIEADRAARAAQTEVDQNAENESQS